MAVGMQTALPRISRRDESRRPSRIGISVLIGRLQRYKATIIVVFLVRADRLSEVIMNDHRPTSSGRASLAELEAGDARRESPGGPNRPEASGVRKAAPRARGHARPGAPCVGSRRDPVRRIRPWPRRHAPP